MVSSFRKSKQLNENWSFGDSIKFIPILLMIWPFVLVVYVWFNIRLRMNNSVEIPERLEVVTLSKKTEEEA
jgi:uncharacterized membrane protein